MRSHLTSALLQVKNRYTLNLPKWLKDIGGSFALTLLARVLGIANATLLARILQPEGYGLYSYALIIVTAIALLAQFGIPTVVMREVAATGSMGKWGLARGVIQWAYGSIGVLTSITLVVVSLLLASQQLTLSRIEMLTYATALLLVPLFALDEMRIAILNGLRYVILSRVPGELLRSLLVFLCLVYIVLAEPIQPRLDATDAMIILVVASLIAYGVGTWLLKRVEPDELKTCQPDYARRHWTVGTLPIALTSAVGFLNQSASTVILGSFLSHTEVGHFRIATLGAGVALIALTTINNGLAPYFSRSFAQTDLARLQHHAKRSAQIAFIVAFGVFLAYAAFGQFAIEFAFGNAYTSAYVPLLILAAGQLVTAATGSAGMILYMTDHAKEVSIGAAIGAIINITAGIILIPRYGIIGAACATAISESIWSLMWSWLVWRKVKIISAPMYSIKY